VMPVQAHGDGSIERGEVRPASHDPRERRAPAQEPAELPDVGELFDRLRTEPVESEDAADLDGTDDPIVERSSLDPAPDPVVEAIRRCITDRDLELLWQADGTSWSTEHRELAAVVMHDLRAARDAERPRAALRAAIESAPDVEALTAIMLRYRDEPWVDDPLRELADTRYWSLMGRRPPQRPALSVVR
jgi:hypothetical protein